MLTPYFISILSRVNKARVARNRVMAFLTSEAIKNEEAAGIVAEILIRQSVTIAIGDKAAAIETMLKILPDLKGAYAPRMAVLAT